MVTLSPPTSEAGVWFPAEKLMSTYGTVFFKDEPGLIQASEIILGCAALGTVCYTLL